jgi:predicted dehydrogenase
MNKKTIASGTRRKFIHDVGLAALSIPVFSSLRDYTSFSDKEKEQHMKNGKAAGKLGIAVVGLGTYGNLVGTALQQTKHAYLAGVVSGTPSKIDTWKSKYNLPDKNIYNYQNFSAIKNNPDIDAVYICLPNSMHTEYVVKAAEAGKHVICEKPLAITVAECDKMIAACKKANRVLYVGYRLQFEPYNKYMAWLGQHKIYGDIKKMTSGFSFMIGDPTQWRLKKDMAGGGPLMDLGIYCVQGFCYTSGLEPISVTAKEGPKTNMEKFKEVEQSISWQFEFPNGIIADGQCSYADNMNMLRAEAENGVFELTSAFNYSGQRGNTPDGPIALPKGNQQTRQIDAMAYAINNKIKLHTDGEMGKRDVKYLQAIYEAMRTGKKITIK